MIFCKKLAGVLLVSLPFVALIVGMVASQGVLVALGILAVVAATVGLIFGGVALLVD